MTDSERLKQFTAALNAVLNSRTAIFRDTDAEIRRVLAKAQEVIAGQLANAPSEYQAWYLPQLQKTVRKAAAEFAVGADGALQAGAQQLWIAGIDSIDTPLQAAGIDLAGVLPAVDTRQLRAMRAFMTDHMKDVGVALADKVNGELGMLITGAQSQGDTIAKVATLLDSGGRQRAITVLRTEVGTAFSIAAHERKLMAAEYLPGLKKLWRRSGKIHSRLTHDAADGQIQAVDAPFVVGGHKLMFPRDPSAPVGERVNCGCESLPHMDSWEVTYPKKMPFSDLEQKLSPLKKELAAAKPLAEVLPVVRPVESAAQTAFAQLAGSKSPPLANRALVDGIMKGTGATRAQAAALADYTGSGYRDINQALRDGEASPERLNAEQFSGYVDALNEMIDRLPRPTADRLVRVLGDLSADARESVIAAYEHIGQEITYAEFLSTSAPGGRFTGLHNLQVRLDIKPVPASRRAGVVGHYSGLGHEKEVLYKTHSRFRVLDIVELKTFVKIVLEELE